MAKSLFTISALSVELRRDRRTLAQALREVPPEGEVRGHKAWSLKTVFGMLCGGDAAAARIKEIRLEEAELRHAQLTGDLVSWSAIEGQFDQLLFVVKNEILGL